jgi:YD repeat-containing protein
LHAAAVTAVVQDQGGIVYRFQIIDLGAGSRAGRITSIEDSRGLGIRFTYQYQLTDDLQGSQARLWQLSSATDAQGNVAGYHYGSIQVSGRWVVDQVTLPTGGVIAYQYAGGYLAGVTHPDGTTSSFSYGWHNVSNCTTLGFNDATAESTHRKKTVHVTSNFAVSTGPSGNFLPQSAQLVRMVIDATDTVSYFNVPHPWGTAGYVYEGGPKMKYFAFDLWSDLVLYARYATTWTASHADPATPWTWSDFSLSLESGFKTTGFSKTDNLKGCYRGEAKWSRDEQNRTITYPSFDAASRILTRTFPDGTTERVTYDAFHQATRRIDRLGRVTEQSFDAVGNRLSRTTGSIWDNTNNLVVPTADTATEHWEYIPAGQTNQYRLATWIDARGNRTDYTLDSRGRVTAVTGPADVAGDARPVTAYEYDAASRLTKIIQPTITNWVAIVYDSRSRVTLLTYADGSTESTLYGVGTDANLVTQKTDRNGNATSFAYDVRGRKIQESVTAPNTTIARHRRPVRHQPLRRCPRAT